MRVLVLFFVLVLFSVPAFAGGDDERVHVEKLTMLSELDYILVVRPVRGKMSYDDRMKDCKQFEVRGTLKRLKSQGQSSGTPTKKEHLAALAFLKKSEGSENTINFGWIGSGFEIINAKNPCIVKSRGLRHFPNTVLSYFYAA